MATIASDTFTEASDTPLESHISDTPGANPSWDCNGDTATRVESSTNDCRANTSSDRWSRHTADVGDDDMDISADCKSTVETNRASGIAGRIPDTEDGSANSYFLFLEGDGSNVDVQLDKVVSSTITNLGSHNLNGTEGTNYALKLELRTNSQVGRVDGTAHAGLSTTDSALSGGNFGGVYIRRNDTNNRIDNFLLESVAAGGGFTPRLSLLGVG